MASLGPSAVEVTNSNSLINYNPSVSAWSDTPKTNAIFQIGNMGAPLSSSLKSVNSGSISFSFEGLSISVMVSYILADDLNPSVACQLDSNIMTGAIPPSSQNNWPLCSFKNLQDGEHKLTVDISDSLPRSTIFFDYLLYTLTSHRHRVNATVESTRTRVSSKNTESAVTESETSSTHPTSEVGTTTTVIETNLSFKVVPLQPTSTFTKASNSSVDISSTTVSTSAVISFTSFTTKSTGTMDIPTAEPSQTVPAGSRNNRNMSIEIAVGVGTFFITIAIFFLWRYKKHAGKRKKTSRELSGNPSPATAPIQGIIPVTNKQTRITSLDHSATFARLSSADSTQMPESKSPVVEKADGRAVLETPQRASPDLSDLNAAILGFRQWSLNRPFPSPTISMFSQERNLDYVDATAEVSEIPLHHHYF